MTNVLPVHLIDNPSVHQEISLQEQWLICAINISVVSYVRSTIQLSRNIILG